MAGRKRGPRFKDPDEPRQKNGRVSVLDRARIVDFYRRGGDLKQLAEALGINMNTHHFLGSTTAQTLHLAPNVGLEPPAASKMEAAMQQFREAFQRLDKMTAAYFEAKGVRVPTVAEGRWAALVARQTISPAQVQGEAEVFGERKDEDGGGQTGEALVVEPAENESASGLLAVPTAECGLTLGPDEETHQPPSPSVVFVSGATPECVSGKPSDRDDRDQDSAPRERKRLQLNLRSVPLEANTEAAAMSKAPELAPKGSSSIFGGARPVDTAAREREIEARLARQRKERRQIRHREPFRTAARKTRQRHHPAPPSPANRTLARDDEMQ
ncbi:uncharacterized protein LOC125757620 [Rhipicephalus sanguineus]|uniref:uncharacterized protein LOC125757620 n=1 Tax=Rhipicephalus sanguineus TaxID=34632 RepID=UPI0020C25283|nr:uncharacterized protein LOC125757620 [Rhipicephalus sanguineus]